MKNRLGILQYYAAKCQKVFSVRARPAAASAGDRVIYLRGLTNNLIGTSEKE